MNQGIDIEWDEMYSSNLPPMLKRRILLQDIKTKLIKEDLPILITQQGEIACIAKSHDIPNLGVVGDRRTAKTVTSWGVIDRLFHSRKDMNFVILNDAHEEAFTHSFKNNVGFMLTKLKILKEQPHPLPLVFLLPSIENSFIKSSYIGAFKVAIPFKDLFKQIHHFGCLVDLGGSEIYFKGLAKLLLKAKNSLECTKIIEDNIKEKGSLNKIRQNMQFILDEKVFDISSNEQPILDNIKSISSVLIKNKLSGEEQTLDPILGFMYMGLIPAIMTHSIMGKSYGLDILTYHLRNVFESQNPEGIFGQTKKTTVCIFVDELEHLHRKEGSKELIGLLTRCVTEGAHRRIMLNWSTQSFLKIDERLRNNTKYLISLRQPHDQAKAIGAEFSLGKKDIQLLQNLRANTFDAMLMGKERIKLYNPKTGKITYSEGGAIKGTILFPLSRPKHPEQPVISSFDYTKKILKKKHWMVFDGKTKERILRLDQKPSLMNIGKPLYPTLSSNVDLFRSFFWGKREKKVHLTLQELEKMGFNIISVHLGEPTYFAGQTALYLIWKEGRPLPANSLIMDAPPHGVTILYDTIKQKVQLLGRNCGPGSVGPWVDIYEE